MTDTSIMDTDTAVHPGRSYEFVAHAAALAVQDATDSLRNINSICTAALGAALASALENPAAADQYNAIARTIQDTLNAANANFHATTGNIAAMLDKFKTDN